MRYNPIVSDGSMIIKLDLMPNHGIPKVLLKGSYQWQAQVGPIGLDCTYSPLLVEYFPMDKSISFKWLYEYPRNHPIKQVVKFIHNLMWDLTIGTILS